MSNSRPATPINRLASASQVSENDLVPVWSQTNSATRKVTWQKVISDLNIATMVDVNPAIVSVNANTTLSVEDIQSIDIILCDTSGAPFTIQLPDISLLDSGNSIKFKRIDTTTNQLTVLPNGSNTIEGDPSMTLSGNQRPSAELITDTLDWYIFDA